MPSTRSASLRVAHARSCPNASKTAIDSVGRESDCTCKPSYYTSHRDASGRVVKGARARNRQVAERSLRALQVDIDQGRLDQRRRQPVTFAEWAQLRLEHIADFNRKPATVRAYKATLVYALPILGPFDLADIGEAELMRVVRVIRERGGSDTTMIKHLKHMATFFNAAVPQHLHRSPLTREFVADLRLAKPARGTPPFTEVVLAKLISTMRTLDYNPVHVAAVRFLASSGLRIGELVGLCWDDLDLTSRTLRVERTWDPIIRVAVAPKDNEPRTVHLIAPAIKILEEWVTRQGVRPGDAPVFPAPRGGRLDALRLRALVAEAMAAAGIPRVGEGGRPRKPLHSLRATFARSCRERGADPQWLMSELGHASLDLTIGTYSAWENSAMRRHADALDFDV